MKKLLFASLTVFSMLAMTTGAAFAAAPASGSAISVIEVRRDAIIFSVSGDFSQSELHSGSIQIQGGDQFTLHCGQPSDGIVNCSIPLQALGKNVVINFGGSTFFELVPAALCYNVYDYTYGNTSVWQTIGENCQNSPAQVGDTIEFYNGFGWNEYYDYDFMDPSTLPCVDFGAGYYYNSCGYY